MRQLSFENRLGVDVFGSIMGTFRQTFIRQVKEKSDSKDLQMVKNKLVVHYAEQRSMATQCQIQMLIKALSVDNSVVGVDEEKMQVAESVMKVVNQKEFMASLVKTY